MLIYLASPYTHPDPNVVEQRFDSIARTAGALMREGLTVYSPIVHCHPIAQRCELPTEWEYWEAVDREMIEKCDEVWVVMIPGWNTSKGVTAEVGIANSLDKKVRYIDCVV